MSSRDRVTARTLGRGSISRYVTNASDGLVSIVEKEGKIFGILTPAITSELSSAPDIRSIGEKAEKMREFQLDNPNASIEEIVEYSASLDSPPVAAAGSGVERLPLEVWLESLDHDLAINELKRWSDDKSQVEGIVEKLFGDFLRDHQVSVDAWGADELKTLGIDNEDLADLLRGRPRASWVRVAAGEREFVAGNLVEARKLYVAALPAAPVAATVALASLALKKKNRHEAALWYAIALG